MDWPMENARLAEADMDNVYRYGWQTTRVLRRLATDKEPSRWNLATPVDWSDWLEKNVPSVGKQSGLVLILAKGGAENSDCSQKNRHAMANLDSSLADQYECPDRDNCSDSSQGSEKTGPHKEDTRDIQGGDRAVRQLPFDKDTFRKICRKFHIHSSISRAISRADMPLFSRSRVKMGQTEYGQQLHSAIVYNCRSANSWKDDLAMTVTYFPRSRLIFGIVFGCTAATVEQFTSRIVGAEDHVFHPLLLPGIFAELERARMVEVVERTTDEIEAAILDLNSGTATREESVDDTEGSSPGGPRYVRRSVWLNTTFLRSRLQIWKIQLHKMLEHLSELPSKVSRSSDNSSFHEEPYNSLWADRSTCLRMQRTGTMIKDRLESLIEELEEKIDECSMRVDGMTIATQWAQGDTNVDIASAAGKDSSQMRSIALVTMVFLPGTFFATLFSMSFFNWFPSAKDNDTSAIVSGYVWIYFLLTGVFTIVTLFLWWYFLVCRRSKIRYPK